MAAKKRTPVCKVDLHNDTISLSPEQCARFGVTDEVIGEGSNATVYGSALDKKSVVKFTLDESDATAMRKLAGRSRVHPGLPVVHDVARLRGHPRAYAIRMERLDTGPSILSQFRTASAALLGELDSESTTEAMRDSALKRAPLPKEVRRSLEATVRDVCDTRMSWDSDRRDCAHFGSQILDVVDALAREGIVSYDLHQDNFGFRRRRPVVLDLGVSQTQDAQPIDLAGRPRRRKARR